MGLFCFCFSAKAQNYHEPTTLKIGDKMPDALLTNIMNSHYKSARLSDFKGKLILLDFWDVWCGSCISGFPKLDSLQRAFPDKLQVLLVNQDNSQKQIKLLIDRLNSWSPRRLNLPIVYQDTLIALFFKFRSIPACAWIGPDGRLIAFTEKDQVTADNIQKIINGQPVNLPLKDDFAVKPKPQYSKNATVEKSNARRVELSSSVEISILQVFGSVDSARSHPIVDASVTFKNTKSTGSTDKNGHFTILLKNDVDTLIISHPGYKTLTKIITSQTKYPLKLTLAPAFN